MKFSEMVTKISNRLNSKHQVHEDKRSIKVYQVTSQNVTDQETYYTLTGGGAYSVSRISRGVKSESTNFDSRNEAEIFLLIILVKNALPFVDVYDNLLAKTNYSFFVRQKFNALFPRGKVFSKAGEHMGTLFLQANNGLYEVYFKTSTGSIVRINREGESTYGDALYSLYLEARSVYAAKLLTKYLPNEFLVSTIEKVLVEKFLKKLA
ncbi:hypothetical protein EQG49_04315 [Periweissella cryptocerci]|uniref:Uncharacterized protein n=1 Tax=Periweissella cryptocerci TaxID=2506420 RepID=A0A4P6YSP1_9LACO|nr:hypothetical protein [Periweissella cryptocerci]QBO35739.1 hypothetical protein EQG49_04315 [Periweissella cryptocerci]